MLTKARVLISFISISQFMCSMGQPRTRLCYILPYVGLLPMWDDMLQSDEHEAVFIPLSCLFLSPSAYTHVSKDDHVALGGYQ